MKNLSILAATIFFAQSVHGIVNVANGDFEIGNLTSWTTSQLGDSTLSVETGAGGSVTPLSGTPSGFFGFAGDQTGPSQNIFIQTVVLPASFVSADFSFDLAYSSNASLVTAPTLDYTGSPNQQLRVDILTSTAAIDSVAVSDVIFNAFQTLDGGSTTQAWTTISQDVSAALLPFAGQGIQIRFAQADNANPFGFGFDNVELSGVVPEPSSYAMILGVLALGFGAFGRRRSN